MERGRNIVLIGFMGSGKTSVGLKLSYRLRMTVEDTDKLIERREGRSVSQVFAEQGEAYFRQQETRLLQELLACPYARIYSVGGGTPVRRENRELLRELGMVVYLQVSPEIVYNRLKGDVTRPLLQCEDPLGRIRELMEERREAYESCADVILDGDGLDMEQILDKIMTELGNLPALAMGQAAQEDRATGSIRGVSRMEDTLGTRQEAGEENRD